MNICIFRKNKGYVKASNSTETSEVKAILYRTTLENQENEDSVLPANNTEPDLRQ